ncbi:helix-turn-helix domain-containing protein [Bifidobacterium pullorum]|uniref:helix-turn-helix domain-containing protein n=1 Tax=Bifidobacterium pullorum TaxID=78448 RepID=UPI0024314A3A|nr:helix-turn-helix transcriptional regulator [Bifidobacterium pullorum]
MMDERTQDRRYKVGCAIHDARKAKGISQEHLGKLADIDRAYMGRIERGEVSVGLDKLWAISDALDTTPSQLLQTAEQAKTPDNPVDIQ